MAVIEQEVKENYAVYNGDCLDVLPELKKESVHISVYSPPFNDLYNYSSSERDLSNCKSYEEFFQHYEFLIDQINRVTLPGRFTIVHCMDIPQKGDRGVKDFPGDIIRLHEKNGFYYWGRRVIWKEPLRMAIRTRAKGLMHKQIVKDSSLTCVAGSDFLLEFRKKGENKIPVTHFEGLRYYAGANNPPADIVKKFGNGWDNPKTNKLSHWIWQQYASPVWMDIRNNYVLEYKPARDSEEEKHVCPLQLDVIERASLLYSNPGEVLLTPFMGVGSEVCGALMNNRKGIGIELKQSYYRQAVKNIYRTLEDDKKQGFSLINGKR